MRRNLDPFEEHNDSELWSVLEEVRPRLALLNIFKTFLRPLIQLFTAGSTEASCRGLAQQTR